PSQYVDPVGFWSFSLQAAKRKLELSEAVRCLKASINLKVVVTGTNIPMSCAAGLGASPAQKWESRPRKNGPIGPCAPGTARVNLCLTISKGWCFEVNRIVSRSLA